MMNKKAVSIIKKCAVDFIEQHWDSLDKDFLGLMEDTKESLIKDINKDSETALWVILEVMEWATDYNYFKEMIIVDPRETDTGNEWYYVIKCDNREIKLTLDDNTFDIEFAKRKKKIIYIYE